MNRSENPPQLNPLNVLTFDLFLDGFRQVQPVGHVVGIGVLEAEVVLLDEVQVIVDLLHQLLSRRFFLQEKKKMFWQVQKREHFWHFMSLVKALIF